jgi:hypothetical protein
LLFGGLPVGNQRSPKEGVTFFEKKVTKKTFALGGAGLDGACACRTGSLFASFSLEKEGLPCLA